MLQDTFQKYPAAHVLAAKSASRDDPFFNYVFAHDRSCYQATSDIIRFFGDTRFHWWIQPHQTSFARHLIQAGFCLNIRVQGMQNLLHRSPQNQKSRTVRIKQVTQPDQRIAWLHIAARALNTSYEALDLLCPQSSQKDAVLYLGLLNHHPASVCLAFYGTTSVGIYWLATLPESRGFGVAPHMIHTVLCDAYERGYRAVTLQSSPSAVAMYHRLGFQSVEQYNLYLWDGLKIPNTQKKTCHPS